MKKTLTIIAVVALFATLTSSCKKNYTCECCVTVSGTKSCASETRKLKKKDAKEWCDAATSTSGGVTSSCELK